MEMRLRGEAPAIYVRGGTLMHIDNERYTGLPSAASRKVRRGHVAAPTPALRMRRRPTDGRRTDTRPALSSPPLASPHPPLSPPVLVLR